MSRLLVLGAGRHQAPLIARANERGVETVAIDPYEDSAGKLIATHTVLGDALDDETVLDAARRFDVHGIATVGTDQALVPWARVADALRIPCHITPEAAVSATNKTVMRTALASTGVPMPSAWTLGPTDGPASVSLRYPLVAKATDSQGQRGMTIVRERDDLEASVAAARTVSRSSTVILEEFVEGPEVTINAWLDDGKLTACSVHDRLTYNPPPSVGICLQHIAPTIHSADAEFRSIAYDVARAYGVERGPLYIQCIMGTDGVRVIEAAARVGGGHEAQLLPRLLGFDLIDRTIDVALGVPSPPWTPNASRVGIVCFVVAGAGEFARLSSFELAVDEGWVDEGAWYVSVGYHQQPVVDSMGRIGYFIVTASDRSAATDRARRAYEQLSVTGVQGDELVYWPDVQFLNRISSM